ncbi:MAG TPA: GNAT family N-acetyltransferase [Candidatus Acidoferrales bacterium]|nr:GNAT family N-acetyltransferase [Candidatus Acidoferrales bacterium]
MQDLDLDAMLAINRECEAQLWPIDLPGLAALIDNAYYVALTGDKAAMLIAFDETSAYDSPNFSWFKQRYPRFAYVDRVAVSPLARGRGNARRLYEELFAKARADGRRVVCAEVYFDPPNPESDAFHAAMGFEEVGRAAVPERGGKTVRYLVKMLT